MRPIKISNPKEANWTKQWLMKQLSDGRLPGLRPDAAYLLSGVDQVKSFVDRYITGVEDRQRLQKALSARRARAKVSSEECRKVVTELEYDARQMLLMVAQRRGVTTSELIRITFEDEYSKTEL